MELVVILLVLAGLLVVVGYTSKVSKQRALERKSAELEPVKKLAFEDITALGEQLQELDLDLAGRELDGGQRADYQRALDAYESAKTAGEAITEPEHIKNVTGILEDGRYAIACVRARVAGEPLPTRRPPCFFDPRHGLSVVAERVRAGAEPDSRMVMVGSQRVPYYQGGRAYQPYAAGYFGGFGPMDMMFMGMMFGGFGGFDAIGDIGDGIGDGIGDAFDGIGDAFDGGFDF
jgi:hypothetical protein